MSIFLFEADEVHRHPDGEWNISLLESTLLGAVQIGLTNNDGVPVIYDRRSSNFDGDPPTY
jgi:hypothetical protein